MALVKGREEEYNSWKEATLGLSQYRVKSMQVGNTFNGTKEESTYEKAMIGLDGA